MKKLSLFGCWTLIGLSITAAPRIAYGKEGSFRLPQPPAQYSYERSLPLEGGQNFRDLGGYPADGGRHVRWGLLFRSGSMFGLTARDFTYLENVGIKTVVDFRDTEERRLEPVNWPANYSPHILTRDYSVSALNPTLVHPGKIDLGKMSELIVALYPVLLDKLNGQYRQMFDELLAGHAPLAFNCTAGRDRTGIAAALLLTALGVPRETVIQDYLLTNRYFDPRRASPVTQQWGGLPAEQMKLLEASARPSIEGVFKVIDRHHGGTAGYLRDRLGLDQKKIDRLRAMYTE